MTNLLKITERHTENDNTLCKITTTNTWGTTHGKLQQQTTHNYQTIYGQFIKQDTEYDGQLWKTYGQLCKHKRKIM
jgi:hypothetical protein